MSEYKPKPTWRWKNCIICGETIEDGQEIVGGKMKRGGTRCAHKTCWDCEQAALAKEMKR
jgi:hypothetical protein